MNLFNLLEPPRLTSVVDIGSNPIDGSPPYTRMLDEGLCTVTGLDPQLTGKPTKGVSYIPTVVGNGSGATLHVCQSPGMTSLLAPDAKALKAFPGFSEWATVVERRQVETTRLDQIEVDVDLLCMDVQGSEIDVLTYGRKKLASAVAVITEVSFVPLYKGQPSFGDIDSRLRDLGFVPHCFASAKVWPLVTQMPVPSLDPHQLLEADIVYVRDFLAGMKRDQWKHLALLAHHVFGSFDLAMYCVEALAKQGAVIPEAAALYRQTLEQIQR